MFIEIPMCSSDHIRRVGFRGSVASRLGYFRNRPQLLVFDL